ncbi:MAG: LytR/AlgR family response regulator transcription factor [Lawsonibacter sp.]|jgi:DNA-binding LytR/AlgR family response regulator
MVVVRKMVLEVLIADDDPAAAAYLKKIIEEVPGVEVVSIAGDGKETIRQVEIYQPDVVFLDIDMPEMNGLDVARELAKSHPRLYFVFATAFPDYALAAFEFYSFDYILKPFNEARIRRTTRSLRDKICNPQNRRADLILIKSDKQKLLIHQEDILYIESRLRKVFIKTKKEEHLVPGRLCDLEQQLDPQVFFRCHKGYLVNLIEIRKIVPSGQSYNIIMHSGEKISLSRKQEKVLLKRFGTIL